MEDKAPQLWDGNLSCPSDLRLPNQKPTTTTSNTSETGEKKKFQLSAEAPEFYPSNYCKQPSNQMVHHSVQERLKKHKTTEITEGMDALKLGEGVGGNFTTDSQDYLRLRHIINTLIIDPEHFDSLVDLFVETLLPYHKDVRVLSDSAQLLVEKAISNPSFRYSAAKLCCDIEYQCAEFRAVLHLTCEKELKDNPNKSGLLLFVAELYTQLHYENIYGSYLIKAFKQLLDLGGNDNVKAICQALKLTGHSLEMFNKDALDEVFSRLQTVRPTVTGTALSLINSVITLRSSHWGYNQINNHEPEQENIDLDHLSNNTIFYSPDGCKLSNEESEFLAQHLHSPDEFLLDDSNSDELYNPEPEMDEEIQAAFKEFVEMSKHKMK